MGRQHRTRSRRTGSGDIRQPPSRNSWTCGTHDLDQSSPDNGPLECGSRYIRRVAASHDAPTSSYVRDGPARRRPVRPAVPVARVVKADWSVPVSFAGPADPWPAAVPVFFAGLAGPWPAAVPVFFAGLAGPWPAVVPVFFAGLAGPWPAAVPVFVAGSAGPWPAAVPVFVAGSAGP